MPEISVMSVRQLPIVEIDASDWYRHPDFIDWVTRASTANWMIPGQDPIEGSSDIFTFIDGRLHEGDPEDVEGSDQSTAPAHYWREIVQACRNALPNFTSGKILVHLTNEEPEIA